MPADSFKGSTRRSDADAYHGAQFPPMQMPGASAAVAVTAMDRKLSEARYERTGRHLRMDECRDRPQVGKALVHFDNRHYQKLKAMI